MTIQVNTPILMLISVLTFILFFSILIGIGHPPNFSKLLFGGVVFLLLFPLFFKMWNKRGKALIFSSSKSLFLIITLLIITISCFSAYFYFYKTLVIVYETQSFPVEQFYFPLFLDEDLNKLINYAGSKFKTINEFGPIYMKKILMEKSLNLEYLLTSFIFFGLFVLGLISAFGLFLLIYLDFFKLSPLTNDPMLLALRKKVIELIVKNRLAVALKLLHNFAQDTQKLDLENHIALLQNRNFINQKNKGQDLISNDEYNRENAKITMSILNLIS